MIISQHIFSLPLFKSAVNRAIEFFNTTPVHALPPDSSFEGAGVYALYYLGNFELYKKIADQNSKTLVQPIYVGKAVPPGWRTARKLLTLNTSALYVRLREHAKSISGTKTLHVRDFRTRFMVLKDIESDLVAPVEAELIRRYRPLWNCCVDGFGNHDPGSGRYNQAKSEWDVLHSGRAWAARLKGAAPKLEKIVAKVNSHFS